MFSLMDEEIFTILISKVLLFQEIRPIFLILFVKANSAQPGKMSLSIESHLIYTDCY